MNTTDIYSLWMNFLQLPFSGLIIIVACIVFVWLAIGFVFRIISRLFFRPLRFAACLLIGSLLIGAVGTLLYKKPMVSGRKSGENSQIIELAADTFKGLYNSQLPLLAWRVNPVKDKNTDENQTKSESESETILLPGNILEAESETTPQRDNPVMVEVSYLPFGKIVLEYDPFTQSFSMQKGIGETENTSFFGDLMDAVGTIQPAALVKTISTPSNTEE